ncbi:RNA binding protein [Flagelloscypha sp. PMI_526]|nr:RNA binding protein [Flagelloscypha sp. PMI_526]
MEFVPSAPIHRILCADCGIPIEPNSANRCVACLRNTSLVFDITEGIPKQTSVSYCRNCERFLSPPQAWTIARPESSELLAICLKKLKGLNKVRLTDAHFIWTEPHSKRLRVSLTIQKEVLTNTILEQTFEIEYLVQYGQCPDCARLAAKNTWKALVQVRQKVSHKRTFLYLEQLILKHGAQKDTIAVKEVRDGLDFFYSQRSHAIKMVEFLNGVVPIKSKGSEQLISSDTHTNTANYKFTYSVEIVPVCKDDLVCLPLKQARSLSNISPLVLCTRVGSSLQLLDPATLQTAELPSTIYWRSPVDSLTHASDLVEFTILDIDPELALAGAFKSNQGTGHPDEDDAGRFLQPGDTAMGYFLTNANFNSEAYAALPSDRIPEVVLVKKAYPNRRKKSKARSWRLRSIGREEGEEGETGSGRGVIGRMGGRDQKKVDDDYELFLRDLEEDPELRGTINLYKADGPEDPSQDMAMDVGSGPQRKGGRRGKKAHFAMEVDAVPTTSTEVNPEEEEHEADFPEVHLDELLDNFDEMTLGAGAENVSED